MPLTLHRFNVTEYSRMADAGVLKWGEHDELLNGVVMDPFYITLYLLQRRGDEGDQFHF
ncbi:MAG TPA: hypothetical protein VNN22_03045 [Verrucomicrobiae bacterium]|nr:hypothetical protein [Verrucomicrobiae bacterium]